MNDIVALVQDPSAQGPKDMPPFAQSPPRQIRHCPAATPLEPQHSRGLSHPAGGGTPLVFVGQVYASAMHDPMPAGGGGTAPI
jgi:hypothetical protein